MAAQPWTAVPTRGGIIGSAANVGYQWNRRSLLKIKNPAYSQAAGRDEFFERCMRSTGKRYPLNPPPKIWTMPHCFPEMWQLCVFIGTYPLVTREVREGVTAVSRMRVLHVLFPAPL